MYRRASRSAAAGSVPSRGSARNDTVARLGDALWAGLAAHARPELVALANDPSGGPAVRSAAAHELAVWHLQRGELALADEWYGRLDPAVVEHAVVAACIDGGLGRHDAARVRLTDWATRRPGDPHLRLHLANQFAAAPDAHEHRIAQFNAVLTAGGAMPISSWGDGTLQLTCAPPGSPPAAGSSAGSGSGALVSVIVPAFDAAATIALALASVQAQTHRDLQIIVVDDASTDGTVEVVRRLATGDERIELVRADRNRGAYACRNMALERARGRFVTVHDADDWVHPERIARQVADLERHPGAPANATYWVRVDRDLVFRPADRHPYKLVGKSTASLMVRRELFGVIGRWDEMARGAADFELLKRLEARFGPVRHLDRHLPLAVSLRAPGSLTGDSATGIASLWHLNGARRQYLEAFTAWHRSDGFPGELPFDPWAPSRPFAVPRLLMSAPPSAAGRTGSQAAAAGTVDLVLAADLTVGAASIEQVVRNARAAALVGRTVALLHEPASIEALDRQLDPAVRQLLADATARLVSSGETVRCRSLERLGQGVPGGRVDPAPDVVADRDHP